MSLHTIMKTRLWAAAALAMGCVGFAASARADTVSLSPSADTALLEYFPENNFGGQIYFNSGTTQNGPRNRGLLRFDIASLIPVGSIINGVSLTMEVVGQPVDGDAPSTFELHRMLRDWGEGTGSGNPPTLGRPAEPGEANWTHRFAGSDQTWAAPGGLPGVDFADFGSGDTYVYGTSQSPYIWEGYEEMTGDVQGWLNNPAENYGWMLISRTEGEIFGARRFASREDSFRAPLLVIDFTPVPEPGTAVLGGMALLWMIIRRWPRKRS